MEHGTPTSVWTNGHRDEYPVCHQEVMNDLLLVKGGVVEWITISVPSEFLLLLLN